MLESTANGDTTGIFITLQPTDFTDLTKVVKTSELADQTTD